MAAGSMFSSIVLLIFFFNLTPSQGRLYSLHDDIVLLSNSTIDRVVYNSPVAWIVEFYSSWCGHCQAFAPTWKKLAKVAKDWQDVIQVAALDCADDANIQTCRDYDVAEYPTIKFFNASMTDRKNKGKNFKEYTSQDKTFINLLHTMVDVAEHQTKLKNPIPDFTSVSERHVEDFLNGNSKQKVMMIVFEEPYSYVGKELALDMMKYPELDVRRCTDKKSPLMVKYNIAKGRLPVLVKVEKGARATEVSRMKRTHADFKRAVNDMAYEHDFEEKEHLRIDAVKAAIEHFEFSHHETNKKQQHSGANTADNSEVYMIDMISGLSNMIWNEVPNHKVIGNDAYKALRNFVGLVSDCFPVDEDHRIKKYFLKLHSSLSSRVNLGRTTNTDFLKTANNINHRSGSAFLTKKRVWHACRGSKPFYRGYPCSLWTLFHTLTVNCPEMKSSIHDDGYQDYHGDYHSGLEILKRTVGYIKNFFGCVECARHFSAMAKNIDTEVKSRDDAILWLWKAHNKANKRLHGDKSEDPVHVKIQFPSAKLCPSCRDDNGEWKQETVLRFLKDHYGLHNIRLRPKANQPPELRDTDQVRAAPPSILATAFTLGLNRYDTSLCLVVYTAIGLVFVALYVYFIRRRRRRPYKYHIHTP